VINSEGHVGSRRLKFTSGNVFRTCDVCVFLLLTFVFTSYNGGGYAFFFTVCVCVFVCEQERT